MELHQGRPGQLQKLDGVDYSVSARNIKSKTHRYMELTARRWGLRFDLRQQSSRYLGKACEQFWE
jgi:hypothetical protein